jgi:hypothetical protein
MRNLYLQARFWTYSMMYGQGPLMPPYTLSHTKEPSSEESFWMLLGIWWTKMTRPLMWLSDTIQDLSGRTWGTLQQSSSQRYESLARRYRHLGRHRAPGRNTRAAIRRSRQQTSVAMENQRMFQDLMGDDTELIPIHSVPGARAYRRLAWSRLNHEAIKLRSKFWREDDPYDSVP